MSKVLRGEIKSINSKKFEGITLISLVITIVVLIILSSVAIYLSLGNNGIFTRAKQAKETTNKQEATEKINLKITTAQMNKYAEKQKMPTLKELSEVLKEDSEIQYVTETSKVAGVEYDVPSENPSSIFTKLNKYPYEFEINSSLQLASIDGVKVSSSDKDNDTENINWKLWRQKTGCVSVEEAIELPKNFNELLIGIGCTETTFENDYGLNMSIANSYSINVTKEMLKDYYQTYAFGAGWGNYLCRRDFSNE